MIPALSNMLNLSLKTEEMPSNTFKLNANRMVGFTDGVEAVKQAIYIALSIERYKYAIYSWNYGVELLGLFGQPMTYVIPELERRITEALLQDQRILDLAEFDFQPGRNRVTVSFIAITVFGRIPIQKEVAV